MTTNAPDKPGPDHAEMTGALAGAIRVVFSFTLLSRLAGLVREILTARVLGDTLIGSSFAAAFLIPNLFRRLFGEGALTAAFLPEYTRLSKDDPELSRRLASLVIGLLALVTGVLTLLIAGFLALTLAAGWAPAEAGLSIRLTILMIPMMPMVCITAILGGMLQSHGRFGPPAAAPLLLNAFMIAAAGSHFLRSDASAEGTAYVVAGAALVASVAQIVWSLAALRGHVRWTRAFAGVGDAARTVLTRFLPVVIGLGALQLSTVVDQVIAMWPTWVGPTMFGRPVPLDEASNSILSAASRFYQFPLGVFGLAVATAVFPLLNRTAGEPAAFVAMLRRGIRLSLVVGVPASVGLVLVADDLTKVMLSGGEHAFSDEGTSRAAWVLVGFAPAVWAYSLNNVVTRAFYAKGNTTTPMRVSLLAVALAVGLNFVLIWWLREAGLAWATSISATVQCVVLAVLFSRRYGALLDRGTLRGAVNIVACTAVMAGLLLGLRVVLPRPDGWSGHALRLGLLVPAGGVAFLAAAIALRLPELRWLVQRAPKGGAGAFLAE